MQVAEEADVHESAFRAPAELVILGSKNTNNGSLRGSSPIPGEIETLSNGKNIRNARLIHAVHNLGIFLNPQTPHSVT